MYKCKYNYNYMLYQKCNECKDKYNCKESKIKASTGSCSPCSYKESSKFDKENKNIPEKKRKILEAYNLLRANGYVVHREDGKGII